MKLYYAPGACSLSPHIVIHEAGLDAGFERVDLRTGRLASGGTLREVNPKGQVPTLVLDGGEVLTEGPAIVQYLADRAPDSGLAPAAGTLDRYRLIELLNYISTELHKGFSPLFKPTTPEDYKVVVREELGRKFDQVQGMLAGKDFLLGGRFTVADAYLFTVTGWAPLVGLEPGRWPDLQAWRAKIAARPAVQRALQEEGLI